MENFVKFLVNVKCSSNKNSYFRLKCFGDGVKSEFVEFFSNFLEILEAKMLKFWNIIVDFELFCN